MARPCSCIWDQENGVGPVVLDPSCSTHHEEATMGDHRSEDGFWITTKRNLRAPDEFGTVQKIAWYIGIAFGILFLFVIAGLIIGTALGVINWIRL